MRFVLSGALQKQIEAYFPINDLKKLNPCESCLTALSIQDDVLVYVFYFRKNTIFLDRHLIFCSPTNSQRRKAILSLFFLLMQTKTVCRNSKNQGRFRYIQHLSTIHIIWKVERKRATIDFWLQKNMKGWWAERTCFCLSWLSSGKVFFPFKCVKCIKCFTS